MGKWHLYVYYLRVFKKNSLRLSKNSSWKMSMVLEALARRQLIKETYTILFVGLYSLLTFVFIPFVIDDLLKQGWEGQHKH